MIRVRSIETPLGSMVLAASAQGLAGAWFAGQRHFAGVDANWTVAKVGDDLTLDAAAHQLGEYFAGQRRQFDVCLDAAGTEFQKLIWREIARIGYGATGSYGALAAAIGKPRAVRAAGAATGRNPLSIIVPCHRVLASDGSLTGYAGGLERKRALLALEQGR